LSPSSSFLLLAKTITHPAARSLYDSWASCTNCRVFSTTDTECTIFNAMFTSHDKRPVLFFWIFFSSSSLYCSTCVCWFLHSCRVNVLLISEYVMSCVCACVCVDSVHTVTRHSLDGARFCGQRATRYGDVGGPIDRRKWRIVWRSLTSLLCNWLAWTRGMTVHDWYAHWGLTTSTSVTLGGCSTNASINHCLLLCVSNGC